MADDDPITPDQFWSKVDVRGDAECWPWLGPKRHGYGAVGDYRAHRIAYQITTGEIPSGLVVRPLCHVKHCCNPAHLAIGTPADNSADDVRDGRTMRGERHGRCKLTDEQVIYIRTCGKRGAHVARELGIAESTVSHIRSGRNRPHVGATTSTRARLTDAPQVADSRDDDGS